MIIDYLKCAQDCDKHFSWITSSNIQASLIKYMCDHCLHFTDWKLMPRRFINLPLIYVHICNQDSNQAAQFQSSYPTSQGKVW